MAGRRYQLKGIQLPPQISICMPVYNGAKYLNEAIESVLNQTLSDFELIIVDDRSSDNSVEIIESIARRDSRIRLQINEKNLGLFANYNACMRLAKAPVIKPFAQDDILHRTMLEEVEKVLASDPAISLVSVRRRWVDESGLDQTESAEINSASKYFPADQAVRAELVLEAALLYLDNFIGEPCTVAFRSPLVGTGFNTNFHQLGDLEYWLRIIDGGKYYFIDRDLCDFRTHSSSASTANARLMLHVLDTMRLIKIYQKRLPLHGRSEEVYMQNAVTILGTHIAKFTDASLLSAFETNAEKQDLTDEQITGELLYFSLLALGRKAEQDATREKNEGKVVELERRLQDIMESTSWRSTAWLRAARHLAGRVKVDSEEGSQND